MVLCFFNSKNDSNSFLCIRKLIECFVWFPLAHCEMMFFSACCKLTFDWTALTSISVGRFVISVRINAKYLDFMEFWCFSHFYYYYCFTSCCNIAFCTESILRYCTFTARTPSKSIHHSGTCIHRHSEILDFSVFAVYTHVHMHALCMFTCFMEIFFNHIWF